MLTNRLKILLFIAVIGLVCSPSKPAFANTDGTAQYGAFNCIRHGYNDFKHCYQTFENNDNSNFQTFLTNFSAEGQGYGATSAIRIVVCFTPNPIGYTENSGGPNLSGLPCTALYDNGDYPDNCPDPDDNCNFWYKIVDNKSFEVSTQDYRDYNYLLVDISVKDAGARANFSVTGRKASITSLTASPNPVIEGSQIQVNWNTEHGYNGVKLFYGGKLALGDGVIQLRDPGCCNVNQGSVYFTAGTPGTAWFELQAHGPGGNGLTYVSKYIEITVIAKSGGGTGNGTIVVTSNISTSWVVSGPSNFSGSGKLATYSAKPSPGDYFISAPRLNGYNGPYYEPGINQTLRSGATIRFEIEYVPTSTTPPPGPTPTPTPTPVPPPPVGPPPPPPITLLGPRILSASNEKCGELNIRWQDNSTNETGFYIYRSDAQNNNDYTRYVKIATVAANVTTYIDKPATNKSYWYIVASYITSPAMLAPSAGYNSAFNMPCTAAITGTTNVYAVNGQTTFNLNNIKDNDVVTIQILIDNAGPASGYITKISNEIAPSLLNPRNLVVTGPNAMVGSPPITGIYPTLNFNVSGKKDPTGDKWSVKFDAAVEVGELQKMIEFSTCSTVHYFDDGGDKTKRFCMAEMLTKPSPNPSIEFNEIAP